MNEIDECIPGMADETEIIWLASQKYWEYIPSTINRFACCSIMAWRRVYDCKPIIERFDFQLLLNDAISSSSMWIAADMGFPGTPISTLANMSYGRMVL